MPPGKSIIPPRIKTRYEPEITHTNDSNILGDDYSATGMLTKIMSYSKDLLHLPVSSSMLSKQKNFFLA